MKNTFNGLVASVLLAGNMALGADTTNLVELTAAPSISPSGSNTVKLRAVIGGANTNSYRVQYCNNLVTPNWTDSTVNTNLCSKYGRTTEVDFAEPYLSTSNGFYRLLRNDSTLEPTLKVQNSLQQINLTHTIRKNE